MKVIGKKENLMAKVFLFGLTSKDMKEIGKEESKMESGIHCILTDENIWVSIKTEKKMDMENGQTVMDKPRKGSLKMENFMERGIAIYRMEEFMKEIL
jgi:hypothetical protein